MSNCLSWQVWQQARCRRTFFNLKKKKKKSDSTSLCTAAINPWYECVCRVFCWQRRFGKYVPANDSVYWGGRRKRYKGSLLTAASRLVTKAWENSRQHDLSSPITAASPSFTPGSRRFMRDERRRHHLTGCASDSLWLASAAFKEAFNQSSNGNVALALSRCRAFGADCFFTDLRHADWRVAACLKQNNQHGSVYPDDIKFCHESEQGGRLISCNPLLVFLKNQMKVCCSILLNSLFTCSHYLLFSITSSQCYHVVHSRPVMSSKSHRKTRKHAGVFFVCCLATKKGT